MRIGFVDYTLDGYHANHFPTWIRESTTRDRFVLGSAWEEVANDGGLAKQEWCAVQGMAAASSAEEVVANSDAVIVLAPNNPESHPRLADAALRSGKPVFVDKTFAQNRADALAMFALAEANGTPLFSASSLRFAPSVVAALQDRPQEDPFTYARTSGGGIYERYLVHQLEMVVAALGTGARSVRYLAGGSAHSLQIRYDDDRLADLAVLGGGPFTLSLVRKSGEVAAIPEVDGFFPPFMEAVLQFFLDRIPPVAKNDTLEVISIIDAAKAARTVPDTWVDVADGRS